MNIVKVDLKRAILSRNMIASIILGLVSILAGMLMEPLKSALCLYLSNAPDLTYAAKLHLIGNSLNKATLWNFGNYFYTVLMPLICCIPYTVSYLSDKKSGFNKTLIIRSNYKNYIYSRIITTFIAGFLSIFIISMIYIAIINLVDSGEEFRSIFYNNTFLSSLNKNNFNLFAIAYSIITSFMGGTYAIMGLAISSLVDNTLVALVSSFTIYYLGAYI